MSRCLIYRSTTVLISTVLIPLVSGNRVIQRLKFDEVTGLAPASVEIRENPTHTPTPMPTPMPTPTPTAVDH